MNIKHFKQIKFNTEFHSEESDEEESNEEAKIFLNFFGFVDFLQCSCFVLLPGRGVDFVNDRFWFRFFVFVSLTCSMNSGNGIFSAVVCGLSKNKGSPVPETPPGVSNEK